MPHGHKPRSGSLQFWPRKRAKNPNIKVKSWVNSTKPGLLGFSGYKAGMTHIILKDNRSTSLTKGEDICWPVTVIECPPIKIISVRLYKRDAYGLKLKTEIPTKNKKDINIEDYDEVRVNVATQPKKTGIGSKKPQIFEIAVGGKDIKQKFEYAKERLDKEIKITEVFKQGQFIDIHGVTKGKGFQGSVKRFGVSLKAHKSEKKRRAIGNLGAWTPKRVSFTIGLPGKMGYHLRTEYNKQLLRISNKVEEINPKGGHIKYGIVRNNYILVKGSIGGPRKRLVRFNCAIRENKKITKEAPPVRYISK